MRPAVSLRLRMMRLLAGWLCLSVLVVQCGCATFCNSKKRCKVLVETALPGVTVQVLNRGEIVFEGETPCEVDIEASSGFFMYSKYEFRFSGKGFKRTSVYREGCVASSYWINLVCLYSAPLGMLIVDPLTYSIYEIDGSSIFAGPRFLPASGNSAISSYRVVSMDRVAGDAVSYDFKLALSENFAISEVKTIQEELGELVKNAYVGSDQAVSRRDVRVEFPDFRIADGFATGRAVVVAVTVVLMNYNDVRRKGIIRVRYPAAQYEIARKWVRDHIENLARDKNIALTTGEIPPAARFYLGAERVLAGNILEVEFETE